MSGLHPSRNSRSEGGSLFRRPGPPFRRLICHCIYPAHGHSERRALFSRVKESQGSDRTQVGKVAGVQAQVQRAHAGRPGPGCCPLWFCSGSPSSASRWGPGHCLQWTCLLCRSSRPVCFLELIEVPPRLQGVSCSVALSTDGQS